jgi:hypothetical protein
MIRIYDLMNIAKNAQNILNSRAMRQFRERFRERLRK